VPSPRGEGGHSCRWSHQQGKGRNEKEMGKKEKKKKEKVKRAKAKKMSRVFEREKFSFGVFSLV
jgi:hypothetical protein